MKDLKTEDIILKIIEKNPGIKFREVMRAAEITNGVLSYCIKKLEKNGLIQTERTFGHTRFYSINMAGDEIILIKYLRQKISSTIIIALIMNRRLSFKSLLQMTNISKSTLSKNLSKLIYDNIVHVRFENREKMYGVIPESLVKKTIDKYFHDVLGGMMSKHRMSIFFILLANMFYLFPTSLFNIV